MATEFISFDTHAKYKNFVNGRDLALEKIYRNHRLFITDLINHAFTEVLKNVRDAYDVIATNPFGSKDILTRLEKRIEHEFDSLTYQMFTTQINLRRKAYMLAHAGEAEAIAQTIGKPAKYALGSHHIDSASQRDHGMFHRIDYQFAKLKRKILDAIHFAAVEGDSPTKALGRVFLALPKKRALPDKPVLRKVKKAKMIESGKPNFQDQESGVNLEIDPKGDITPETYQWDSATWDQMVKDYRDDYIPIDRTPEDFFDIQNPYNDLPIKDDIPEDDKIYQWEVEQETTHDFVDQVRGGQVDAANTNGIDEFVWIAVIDKKTCDLCCAWRSGLLTHEIEKRLAEDGELKEYCDAVVPPAHFNCRCTIAPASKDLEPVDNKALEKDFDSWLNGE